MKGDLLFYVYPTGHPLEGSVYPAIICRQYEETETEPAAFDLCVFTPTPDEKLRVRPSEEPRRGFAFAPEDESDGVDFVPEEDANGGEQGVAGEPQEPQLPVLSGGTGEPTVSGTGGTETSTTTTNFAPDLLGLGEPIRDVSEVLEVEVVSVGGGGDDEPPEHVDLVAGQPVPSRELSPDAEEFNDAAAQIPEGDPAQAEHDEELRRRQEEEKEIRAEESESTRGDGDEES